MAVATVSFIVFAAAQVGTPGPANMTLLATGARHGLGPALPFVAGVILGKQFLIWPIGFGLMELAGAVPGLFGVLKWASAAYVCWLAWRIAGMRLAPVAGRAAGAVPGFIAGLLVHPLNPKAWAMIIAAFAGFVAPGSAPLGATATIAAIFLVTQVILHPVWTLAGDRVAATVAGTPIEKYLMGMLAALTVLSVAFVLFVGGAGK